MARIGTTWLAALLLGWGLTATTSQAQEVKPPVKTSKPDTYAVIVAFTGVVDVKRPTDKKWVKAVVAMQLPAKSEICTGYGSKATLMFSTSIKVDVQSLTQAGIEELQTKKKSIQTKVKLRFGGADVDVQKSDIKTDLQVATPVSTTSVSGSRARVYAWARKSWRFLMIRVERGNWRSRMANGMPATVSDGGSLCSDGRTRVELNFNQMYEKAFDFGLAPGETYAGGGSGDQGSTDPTFGTSPPVEQNSTLYKPDSGRQDSRGVLPGPPPPPNS